MFWMSIVIAVAVGLGGYLLSWEISCAYYQTFTVGISGTIIVLAVLTFVVSVVIGRLVWPTRG
jgi:hypothetical protein